MPRNGSTSASSWWRKVDSDNSTPARNAPIAIDSPPICMASAAPSTTSSAAAVITSRASAAASRRNIGLSSQRPAAISAATEASAMPISIQRDCASVSAPPGARKAMIASSGTIARSSSSRIDMVRWPAGVAVSPRSFRICMTIAVEDSTKPMPATKATRGA